MPNEVTEGFRYLPFGGGRRKCVGDQFALFEAVVGLSMLLRRFDFERAPDAPPVGMTTGALRARAGLAGVGAVLLFDRLLFRCCLICLAPARARCMCACALRAQLYNGSSSDLETRQRTQSKTVAKPKQNHIQARRSTRPTACG